MANITMSRASKQAVTRLLNGREDLYNKVVYRSLKKAVKGSKTDQEAAVTSHYNLKKKIVKDKITTRGPYSFSDLSARTIATDKPISLTTFTGTRQVNAGVSVKVLKAGGKKVIPRAFIQKAKGAEQAFWRVREGMPDQDVWPDKKRWTKHVPKKIQYPQGSNENLRALKGPRITDRLDDPVVTRDILKKADVRLQKELNRQIDMALRYL